MGNSESRERPVESRETPASREKGTEKSKQEMKPQKVTTQEANSNDKEEEEQKPALTFYELMYVLRPYFWPQSGTDGAFLNRIRSTSTWYINIRYTFPSHYLFYLPLFSI